MQLQPQAGKLLLFHNDMCVANALVLVVLPELVCLQLCYHIVISLWQGMDTDQLDAEIPKRKSWMGGAVVSIYVRSYNLY